MHKVRRGNASAQTHRRPAVPCAALWCVYEAAIGAIAMGVGKNGYEGVKA